MKMWGESMIAHMEKKHVIELTPKERRRCLAIVSKGRNKASVIRRAHMLLKSDEGKTDREISDLLYISEETVRRIRVRFCAEGLIAALEDKPHPPPDPALNDEQEAYLMALACSAPPAGQKRWTAELLAQQLIDEAMVETVSPTTIRTLLKKTSLNLGE
jgi:putative transposase